MNCKKYNMNNFRVMINRNTITIISNQLTILHNTIPFQSIIYLHVFSTYFMSRYIPIYIFLMSLFTEDSDDFHNIKYLLLVFDQKVEHGFLVSFLKVFVLLNTVECVEILANLALAFLPFLKARFQKVV